MSTPEPERIYAQTQGEVQSGAAESAGKGRVAGAGPAEAGNIDKIRDILFGAHIRDFEKRMARVEERLMKESSDLREELRRRFDSLESFTKRKLSRWRIDSEQNRANEASAYRIFPGNSID